MMREAFRAFPRCFLTYNVRLQRRRRIDGDGRQRGSPNGGGHPQYAVALLEGSKCLRTAALVRHAWPRFFQRTHETLGEARQSPDISRGRANQRTHVMPFWARRSCAFMRLDTGCCTNRKQQRNDRTHPSALKKWPSGWRQSATAVGMHVSLGKGDTSRNSNACCG